MLKRHGHQDFKERPDSSRKIKMLFSEYLSKGRHEDNIDKYHYVLSKIIEKDAEEKVTIDVINILRNEMKVSERILQIWCHTNNGNTVINEQNLNNMLGHNKSSAHLYNKKRKKVSETKSRKAQEKGKASDMKEQYGDNRLVKHKQNCENPEKENLRQLNLGHGFGCIKRISKVPEKENFHPNLI